MIIFLNFAPFDFMGGSEKWMIETASKINKYEPTMLIDVSPSIANIYGRFILKRKFKSHRDNKTKKDVPTKLSLNLLNFIPFTKPWKQTKQVFKEARVVYARFEILEILLCIYFGGFKLFKKTVAGIILTPIYSEPQGSFQKLHNILYASNIYKFFLKISKKVHVLNKRDERYLLKKFKLTNVIYMPLGTDLSSIKKVTKLKDNKLNIIVVGELSLRKGTDTLYDIITLAPEEFSFNIIGDGPLKEKIIELTKKHKNCIYHGYVSDSQLHKIYESSDVILFPSRAEAFGLVIIEAAARGLKIVNSKEVSLGLPSYIETSIDKRDPNTYLKILIKILKEKNASKIQVRNIIQYAYNHFSKNSIDLLFMKRIIEI